MLETIDLQSVRADGDAFQIEVTYRAIRAGFSVTEVPIVFSVRTRGSSKMPWRIAVEALWLVPQLPWRRRPSRRCGPSRSGGRITY